MNSFDRLNELLAEIDAIEQALCECGCKLSQHDEALEYCMNCECAKFKDAQPKEDHGR